MSETDLPTALGLRPIDRLLAAIDDPAARAAAAALEEHLAGALGRVWPTGPVAETDEATGAQPDEPRDEPRDEDGWMARVAAELDAVGDETEPAKVARGLRRASRIFADRLHDPARAYTTAAQLLALEGAATLIDDPALLEELAQRAREAEALPALVEAYEALAQDQGTEPAARVRLLEEIAELCAKELGRADEAAVALREALALEPGRRRSLHRLLQLDTAAKRWSDAVATLAGLAAVEDEPEMRARYLYAAAVIERDERRDTAAAARLFEGAHALSPGHTKAAEAALRLLRAQGDLTGILRLRHRALASPGVDRPTEEVSRLWVDVALLAERSFGDAATALAALEAADRLQPAKTRARLARIAGLGLEVGGPALESATAAQRALLVHAPEDPAIHRALLDLHGRAGRTDGAAWAAAALVALGRADEEEARCAEGLPDLARSLARLSPQIWDELLHPDTDDLLEGLLGVVAPALALLVAPPHRGPEGAPVAPPQAIARAAALFGVAAPEVVVEGVAGNVELQALRRDGRFVPTLVLSPAQADALCQGLSGELAFEVARRIALLRPAWRLRVALPTQALLELAVCVALRLGGTAPALIGADPEVERLARLLRPRLRPAEVEALEVGAARWLAEHQDPDDAAVDVRRYVAASELSAARAALLLTGDLPAAVRALRRDRTLLELLDPALRVQDLLLFAASEVHLRLRATAVHVAPEAEEVLDAAS
jgi:hypothetical protein